MFRKVEIPSQIPGTLLLHSMPGLHEPTAVALAEIEKEKVQEVVCLAPETEIRDTAPAYLEALRRGLPCKHTYFPIEDFSTGDEYAFTQLARDVAARLRAGENVLIHCGAGIGRSGTLAVAVLIVLGIEPSKARELVEEAGSHPETHAQLNFLVKLALLA